jgi:hypothetical protein
MAFPVAVVGWALGIGIRRLWALLRQGERRGLTRRVLALVLRSVLVGVGVRGLIVHAETPSAALISLDLALLVTPICWPRALAACGLDRAAAVTALLVRPLLWYDATRRQVTFFVARGSAQHPGGRLSRRLNAELAGVEHRSRGVELASRAIQALHEGRVDEARTLLSLVAGMSPKLSPRHVRAYSKHLLLADAALRGGWYEVEARAAMGPRTPTAALFAFAARRRLGVPSLGQRLLGWCGWALAPHRVWGLRLLEWARLERARLAAREEEALAVGRDMALGERVHAWTRLQAAAPGSLTPGEIAALARSIDTLQDDADALGPVSARIAELGVDTSARDVLGAIGQELREQLSVYLELAWMAGDALGAAAADAAFEARSRLLDELEHQRDVLCDREDPKRRVNGVALWLSWGKLRTTFDRLSVLSADTRGMAFDAIADALTNVSAQLWNEAEDRSVAHDIFHFLYQHRACTLAADRKALISKNRQVSLQLDAV